MMFRWSMVQGTENYGDKIKEKLDIRGCDPDGVRGEGERKLRRGECHQGLHQDDYDLWKLHCALCMVPETEGTAGFQSGLFLPTDYSTPKHS